MPFVLELSTQPSIIAFTEVFHGLLLNTHGDKPQKEAGKGRVMAFFKNRDIRIQSLGFSTQCSVR